MSYLNTAVPFSDLHANTEVQSTAYREILPSYMQYRRVNCDLSNKVLCTLIKAEEPDGVKFQ